jgi:3-methyladenine DNA glycosylase AlkD
MTASQCHLRLLKLRNPSRAMVMRSYFKTGPGEYGAGDRFLGIPVPMLRRLARAYQDLSRPEVSRLLASKWHEERLLALLILVRQYRIGSARQRNAIYRMYMRRRVRINNWDLVDSSAEHIVGAQLRDGDRAVLERLAKSPSVWDRRIAIMATFHYVKRGEYGETLKLAHLLRSDQHDLIHKAVGWMLREIGKRDRSVEERFLRQHGKRMPRTMLRCATEHFPPQLRRRYLAT